MPHPSPKWFAGAFFLVAALFSQVDAHAVFDFSVSPRRGGQNLHIRLEGALQEQQGGGILRNEEVRVTINTTEGMPYRITETVNQVPTDVRTGKTLPLNSFFQFSPSSTVGRLETVLESPVAPGVKQIYTNSTGEADEFFLVFNVRLGEDQPGGLYRTQITFTAEALSPGSASFSPRVVVMNVDIEIPQTFRMTTRSARGGKELDLGRVRKDGDSVSAVYRIDVDSNIGTEYRIIQQMTESLSSPEGETIEAGAFAWSLAQGNGSGSEAKPIAASPEILYRSDAQGNGDALQIQYTAAPPAGQKAGVYRGMLAFKVESNSPLVRPEIVSVPVVLEVEPILYLDIETRGGGGISFGRFRPQDEAKEIQVLLKVHTNLGKEYTVSQILPHALAARDGSSTISADALQFYGSEAQSGVLTAQSPTPVKEGETVVYRSDSKGKAESFSLNYRLAIPKDTPAGAYNSELKYSITTV